MTELEKLWKKHEQFLLLEYLNKETNIHNEIEYYEGFHYLLNKYGREHLFEWYNTCDDDSINGFPFFDKPKNDFEKDVNEIHIKVKNPRKFSSTQQIELEKRVLDFLISGGLENNINNLIKYINRYEIYRSYYVYKYILPDTDKS
jgi:hypothetical protein